MTPELQHACSLHMSAFRRICDSVSTGFLTDRLTSKANLNETAMKVLLTMLVLLLATTLPGFPQTAGNADATRSKLLALENAWNQAEEHKDAKALETLLDPDLVYVNYAGSVMTKGEYIASIKAPGIKPEQIVNESMTAYLHGDSAVVSGVYRENGVKNGTPYERRERFTDTWVYEGGQWMCVASQSTVIAR